MNLRRRVFQKEGIVVLLLLGLGVLGMPALLWSLVHEERALTRFYIDTYTAMLTFDREWWAVLIVVCLPAFLFEVACTLVWAWKSREALWAFATASPKIGQPNKRPEGTPGKSRPSNPGQVPGSPHP